MSKISLKHSGGNVVSLNSPTSAPTSADVAFKLPNADGTNGQRIITDGSGNLSFASSGASGKILQVVTTPDADRTAQGSISISSQGGTTDLTAFALSITPSAATSKIRISLHIGGEINYTDSIMFLKLKRAISGGATTNIQGATVGSKTEVITSTNSSSSDYATTLNNLQFSGLIDSPNTTSAITYTPVIINIRNATHTFYYNRTVNNEDAYNRQHSVSWVTLEEVAA
jgi:hypothetical protein